MRTNAAPTITKPAAAPSGTRRVQANAAFAASEVDVEKAAPCAVNSTPSSDGIRYRVEAVPIAAEFRRAEIEEIVAFMRAAGDRPHGQRMRALTVILWRAGRRINEALELTEGDLDEGPVRLVRRP
jgi:integrase